MKVGPRERKKRKPKSPQEFEADLAQLVALFNQLKKEDHWDGIRMHVVTTRPGRYLRWRKRTVATLDIELTAKGRTVNGTAIGDLPVM